VSVPIVPSVLVVLFGRGDELAARRLVHASVWNSSLVMPISTL